MQMFQNLSADDVSAVMSTMPAAALQPEAGIIYSGTTLTVPTEFAAAAAAAVSDLAGSRKSLLRAYAASVRYAKEVDGLTVNGSRYLTDRETQSKLTAATVMAQISPSTVFQWKTSDGFVELDAQGIAEVAISIGIYVQACFAMESAVIDQINAATITTAEQVDGVSWPPNS